MKKILVFFLLYIPIFIMGQNVQQDNHKFNTKNPTQKVIVKKVKVNEKKTVIQPNYPTEAYLKAHNVPEDFPRYKDTGNPKLDGARYHDEKQAWIKKHPKEFEKIKHLNL
ncbi:MAG: hypothetical protein HPY79_00065 [Bacteroidales bacterium]|nr:hypothetical protein [Bacteroidales bacterium]